MDPQLIAALILLPIMLIFIYAGIHEYLRYKSEGKATYGLVYDEETGTTHVTGIADDEEAYDPDDFDPNDYNDPEIKTDGDERK
jgi:hypothetical protein